jgi:phosphoglycerate-specific signal transduction histidine kinase
MMTRTSLYPTDVLFKGLKTLLTSLPSEEEKGELIQTLRDTRSFLEELELLVEAFPTIESSRGLSEGLARLDVLAGLSDRDTRLKRLMGFQVSQVGKSKSVNGSGDVAARAERLKESLKDSGDDSLAKVMETSGESISVLTELAASMGLRTRSKERKTELIKRIATHLTNQRGYRMLRGEGPDEENHTARLEP